MLHGGYLKNVLSLQILILMLLHFTASADEPSERNVVIQSAQSAFENKDFLKLENLSNKYDEDDKRTGSGAQKASLFDDGIYNAFKSDKGSSEDHIRNVVSITKK